VVSIMEDFSASLHVFSCLDPKHPKFSTVEVVLTVEEVELQANLQMTEYFFRIQEGFLDIFESNEEEILEKVTKKYVKQYFMNQPEEEKGEEYNLQPEERKQMQLKESEYFDAMGETQFLTSLKQEMDVMEQLDKDKNKPQEEEKETDGLGASFKIYAEIKKFTINVMEDSKD